MLGVGTRNKDVVITYLNVKFYESSFVEILLSTHCQDVPFNVLG